MSREHEPRDGVVARIVERLTTDDRARADGGRPPVIVLQGRAGIGKSHVAHTVAQRLEAAGTPVRRAAGGEAQRRLAFGALLHLLPSTSAPVTAEFELVQRLRAALIDQEGTAVLVIDDVNLLDERSAGLVENVVLQGDVALLVTERTALTGAPADHALSPVLRSHGEVVAVPPMGEPDLVRLLTDWNGPGELGSVRRLSEMAEGNPLVLKVLLASARAAGALGERDGLWFLDGFRLSDYTLERLVEEHLDRLGDQEWELLRCVAVAGSLPRKLAARIDTESLERLERDGLVGSDPTRIGHPFYSEVIVDTLSAEQVRRVCSKLVASVGPDDDVDAARLGSWLLRAEHDIDDSVARRGAALALARWENDLARDLLEVIVEPTVADRVQLIWAHANAGRIEEASVAAEAACAAAATPSERVDAGIAHAELWALQMSRSDDAFAALAALRSELDDPLLIAKVDGATALYSHVTGHRQLAVTAAEAAVAASGDVSDPGVRLAVLIGDAFDKVFTGRFHAAGAVIEEGLALAEQLGERHNWVRLRIAEALRGMFTGALHDSRAIVAEALRLADLSGVRPAHVVWLGLDTQLAQVAGDFVLAEIRGREAMRAGDHVDDFGAAGFVRGDFAALMIEMGRSTELGAGSSPIGLARARIRQAAPDVADELAAELAEHTAEAGYGLWAPWVAREAVRRGPAPRCTELLTAWSKEYDGPVIEAFTQHAVGLVDADAEVVAGAAASLDGLGFRMPSLDAHVAALELHLADGGESPTLRRRVLEVMVPARRVRPALPPHLAARLDAVSVAAEMPSGRQLEIADLAAAGMASKEIASHLIVSARTVDNHLAAVYRKLDIGSRDELTAILRPT